MLKANDTSVDSESYLAKKIWARAQLRELARNGKLGLRVRTEPVAVGGSASASLIQDRPRVPAPTELAAAAETSAEMLASHHRAGDLVLSDAMA